MSLTVVEVDAQDVGRAQRIVADITFDSSYPWDGEPITALELGFRVGSRIFDVSGQKGKYRLEFVPEAATQAQTARLDRGALLLREQVPPGQDFTLSTPLLAIGTSNAAQIKITNAVVHISNGGTPAEDAAAEHAFASGTDDIAADADTAQERRYLLSSTDGANVVVTPGTIADEGSASPPSIPSNAAPIGLVRIVVEAGAVPFNATTDLLSDSHLTVTFQDLDQQVYQGRDLSGLTMRVVAHGF